ncbi:MAG: hypothetical protein ACOC6E_03850, partial [Thermodesulfobacteriota bacterium]
MKAVLVEQEILPVKINHVVFRKVTEDDEVVPRDEITELSPQKREQSKENSKRLLMDMLMESVLMEELGQTLDLKSILEDPRGLSRDMVEADVRCSKSSDPNRQKPGFLLLHQLQTMGDGISQGISGGQGARPADVAVAVFEMKRELLTQMAAREVEDIRYVNEKEIRDEANEITDMVLMSLLKSEYMGGDVSVQRLAQIIRRLIPDVAELRRELPKIKTTLLEAGMLPDQFLQLVRELDRELEGEELGSALRAGSEAVGVQSKDIFEELKRDPGQAAALICLAAEMRKATSDENLLTDLLVNYVEGLARVYRLFEAHAESRTVLV